MEKAQAFILSNAGDKEINMNKNLILLVILILGFCLNIYGINWGLPHRWNVDEQVATTLHMIGDHSLVPRDLTHPPLYFYCLALFLCPYLIFLKITNYPFNIITEAASVSWLKLSLVDPAFAINIYLIARLLSAIFGVLTIYAVFLIGKRLYDENLGLISALILSVCMGFSSINHFAQGTSLVNLLCIITVVFCLKAIDENEFRKNFYLACLFSGLTFAAKYNGAILIVPLITAYVLIYRKSVFKQNIVFNRQAWGGIFSYLAGILIGWPTLLTNFKNYYGLLFTKDHTSIFVKYPDYATVNAKSGYFQGMINYSIELIHIFGLPLALFVTAGIIYCVFMLFKRDSFIKKDKLILLFSCVLPYYLIICSFNRPPLVKYAIIVIPFMANIGAIAIYKFISALKFHRIRYLFVVFTFVFSILYTFSSDLIFAKNDTRYKVAQWINKNIPENSTIEIFTQPSWVLSDKIFPRQNIVFLGRSSFESKNSNIYNAFKDSNATFNSLEDYFKDIPKNGLRSDYILIPYFDDIDNYLLTGPQGDKFIYNLLKGRLNYKFIKEFSSNSNWLWNIKTDYTSPTIFLFKRRGP